MLDGTQVAMKYMYVKIALLMKFVGLILAGHH